MEALPALLPWACLAQAGQGLQEQLGTLPGWEGLRLQVLLGNDGPRPLLPLLGSGFSSSTPLAQAELDFFCCFPSSMWLGVFSP